MNRVDPEAHRAFLNRYYGWSRPIYDLTRKHYLLGRDVLLDQLVREPWRGLVEMGPGTGRNLAILARRRPDARLGGIEPCDAMLAPARRRLPRAQLIHGFAETADLSTLDLHVDRVLFSYSLSMMGDPGAALDRALAQLAPGGELAIVDFGDLGGMPMPVRGPFHDWLRTFHVTPVDPEILLRRGARLTWGPGRYYMIARVPAPVSA